MTRTDSQCPSQHGADQSVYRPHVVSRSVFSKSSIDLGWRTIRDVTIINLCKRDFYHVKKDLWNRWCERKVT